MSLQKSRLIQHADLCRRSTSAVVLYATVTNFGFSVASLQGAAVAWRGEPPVAATAVVAHPPAVQLAHPPDKVRQASLLTDSWYRVPWWYRRFSSPSGADVFRPGPQARVLAQLVTGHGQGALPGPDPRRDPP